MRPFTYYVSTVWDIFDLLPLLVSKKCFRFIKESLNFCPSVFKLLNQQVNDYHPGIGNIFWKYKEINFREFEGILLWIWNRFLGGRIVTREFSGFYKIFSLSWNFLFIYFSWIQLKVGNGKTFPGIFGNVLLVRK